MKQQVAGYLLTLAMLLPGTGNCSEWMPVGETDELSDYVDAQSIARTGNSVKAWFLDDFYEAQHWKKGAKPFMSRKSYVYFNCKQRTFAISQIILYSKSLGRGDTVHKTNPRKGSRLRYEEVPPDSLLEDMLDFACYYDIEEKPGAPAGGLLSI